MRADGSNVTRLAVFDAARALLFVASGKTADDLNDVRLKEADSCVGVVDECGPTFCCVKSDPGPPLAVVLLNDVCRWSICKRCVACIGHKLIPGAVRVERWHLLVASWILCLVCALIDDARLHLNGVLGHDRVGDFKNAVAFDIDMRPLHGNAADADRLAVRLFKGNRPGFDTSNASGLDGIPAQHGPRLVGLLALWADIRIRAAIVRHLDLPAPVAAVNHVCVAVLLVFQQGDCTAQAQVHAKAKAIVREIAHRVIAEIVALLRCVNRALCETCCKETD